MTISALALLAGLSIAPLAMLWLGHRLRDHGPRRRSVFVGVLVGYAAGTAVLLWAAFVPPVAWAGEGTWRHAAVHWSLLAGAAAGAIIGALLARRAE